MNVSFQYHMLNELLLDTKAAAAAANMRIKEARSAAAAHLNPVLQEDQRPMVSGLPKYVWNNLKNFRIMTESNFFDNAGSLSTS